jgi:hypothetical protein
MKKPLIPFLLLSSIYSYAQNTVGLISYDISRSYQGFTMIYPHNQPNVYLLDNCGEIVHTWEDEAVFRPGNTAYLMPDGNLIKTKRHADSTVVNPIWAGGGGQIVEVLTWDNDLLATFDLNTEAARLHHDIAPMPNGNVLLVAWEAKSREESIQAGRDSMLITQGEVWPEMILEWNPTSDEIVWEWHVWDHLVQDFDDTKDNFGNVAENFRRIDVNYNINDGAADWLHYNSIDYNEQLDQIMVSVPHFDEIWVIDHSTTTEEAATSFGGRANHGGDIIYRIGNPRAYRRDSLGQTLFFNHDAHWANTFLDPSDPNVESIVVFNNRLGENFSGIEVFQSSYSMYESDYLTFDDAFPPFEFENTIIPDSTPFAFHSTGLSGAQLLPNGNVLACSGRQGRIIELTPNNDIVWEYITPRIGPNPATQGDTLALNNNLTFRAFKYPPEYSAFDGRDLDPKGWIELEPDAEWCNRLVSTNTPEIISSTLFPNPAVGMVQIVWDSGEMLDIKIV